MSRPIFAIRPEPGLAATLEAGREVGLVIMGFPLFDIRPIEWEVPAVGSVDGLLLGSANAVRHAGAALGDFLGKPAYAVGATTAEAARRAGFAIATVGTGGLQALLDELASQKLRLLRLAGVDHVPLSPPASIELTKRVVYQSVPLEMPFALAEALQKGGLILLHSAGAALHFEQECRRLNIPRQNIALAALGPRIAEAAGLGWAALRSAEEPSESALLALVQDMCH